MDPITMFNKYEYRGGWMDPEKRKVIIQECRDDLISVQMMFKRLNSLHFEAVRIHGLSNYKRIKDDYGNTWYAASDSWEKEINKWIRKVNEWRARYG